MPDKKILLKAAGCLKTMAHPVRLKIADVLSRGERNVKELAEACLAPHNQICEHLKLMRHCGLVKQRKVGHFVYYSLCGEKLKALLNCIKNNF